MRIIVGGEASKAGKTTVVCRLIRGFPDIPWTAVKISGHGHGLEPGAWALTAETVAGSANDTQRYLEAGAAHALWLRGGVEAALPALKQRLAFAPHWIIESTRAADWLDYDLAILVTAREGQEVKPGAGAFRAWMKVSCGDPHLIEQVANAWQPERGSD